MKKAAIKRTKKKCTKRLRFAIHPLALGFGIVTLIGLSLFNLNHTYTPAKIAPTKNVLGICLLNNFLKLAI